MKNFQFIVSVFTLLVFALVLVLQFIANHHMHKFFKHSMQITEDLNSRISRIERVYGMYNDTDRQRYDVALERVEQVQREWLEAQREQLRITCPRCGQMSYNPEDVAQKYCGNCHAFHADMRESKNV